MAAKKKNLREKRQHARYQVRINAQLKMSLSRCDSGKIIKDIQNINAMAETNNISIGGMSLSIVGSSMDARLSLTKANAALLIGKTIEVVLDNENIIVWGEVIRSDANTLELGIVISKVSDVRLWKKLCSEQNKDISIFPDSLQVRRKRRS